MKSAIKNTVILEIIGNDSTKFLQRLLSNNVEQSLCYALLLTPQGKVLYDLFLHKQNHNNYLLECHKTFGDELLDTLNIYKMRSQIELRPRSDLAAYVTREQIKTFIVDPRDISLGYRGIGKVEQNNKNSHTDLEWYLNQHYTLALPRGGEDFFPKEYFPFELNLNNFNAISYDKGCYIGQEVVTRTKFRGTVRKGVYKLKEQSNNGTKINHGDLVFSNDKKAGVVLGQYSQGILALLKHPENNIKYNVGENALAYTIDV